MRELSETTIREVMERYEVLLFDAYGVLVHSSGALAGAQEVVGELNARGRPYYVLTNDAAKLPETTAARLRSFGLSVDPERIITSGSLLVGHFSRCGLKGARTAVLGPSDSERYVELAGGEVVPPGAPFDALVVCDEEGFSFLETVDAVLSALFRKVDRGELVHLVLPNPDLVYPKAGEGFGIAAGSIALVLEAALALRYPTRPDLRFERLGKPNPAIFAEAQRRSGTRNMVMIGDQLETDIRGARDFGLDSVLVRGGVTSRDPGAADGVRPTYVLPSLAPPKRRQGDP